jgi:hypothetical protein
MLKNILVLFQNRIAHSIYFIRRMGLKNCKISLLFSLFCIYQFTQSFDKQANKLTQAIEQLRLDDIILSFPLYVDRTAKRQAHIIAQKTVETKKQATYSLLSSKQDTKSVLCGLGQAGFAYYYATKRLFNNLDNAPKSKLMVFRGAYFLLTTSLAYCAFKNIQKGIKRSDAFAQLKTARAIEAYIRQSA